ncbi:NUDIX hydrolase [Nocardioides sp. zg-536]|uniref:NUDIX hydrolase n=1 Tax=Nocardioides faecalis TaxID=2803858 RepID=A0A939BZ24_9ACTN|nr:NUDIX hydrolase [Nocardioides faecalis]MBM9460585.1 NUDIX hydrolase [Nocardioides faecalis]QVI57489.1 NUDIX hydrolase [Nocardioides faecalis]
MARFASVVLIDTRGWVLLQERDEHPVIDPERWGFVGGHVDDGEASQAAAHRELEEETGLRLAPPALRLWQQFTVFHAAYGTDDEVRVYVARTDATDADITVGEGRRILFVDPAEAVGLPLTVAAAHILPELLNSPYYQDLLP